jgi:hypothetical protein
MPGAAEFAQTEERISRMTDAELVEMADHAADYEPWALDLGRAELARPRPDEAVLEHLAVYPLALLGLVAFPFYFAWARRFERAGRKRFAFKVRLIAGFIIFAYVSALVRVFVVPRFFPI